MKYNLLVENWNNFLNEVDVSPTSTMSSDTVSSATTTSPTTDLDDEQEKKAKAKESLVNLQTAIKSVQDQAATLTALLAEAKKKKAGDRCTRIAKRKYKVWPSAYASGAVVKCRQGKIWKGISESATDEEIDYQLLMEELETIDEKWSEKYKRSIDCNNPKGFSQKAHCQGRKKNESIARNDDIIEERSRAANVSVLKQLQPYSKDSSYYVTFTDLEKVGVNPNNKFATPIGVYAYNLKDLWNDWVSGDRFFGDDRKYVNLLKLNTDKVFDFQNYTNYEKDYQFLKDIYQRDYESTTGISFEDYIQTLKEKATLYQHNTEAAEIWDTIQSMLQINDRQATSGLATKRSTILWNKTLRDMGYDAVVDKGSNIHLLQSSQAIFLSPQSYDIVDRFVNRTYKQAVENEDKWGSNQQPFWRPGVNPTIDNVIFKNDNGLKVLLIKRSSTSKAEANKYAFPGGFHDTNQPKGQPWKNDRESARQAAFRELAEETGLWIPTLNNVMKLVGSYEGNKRDPRDNEEAWSKTTAFAILLPEEYNDRVVSGRDDAQEAIWIPIEQAQKMDLAFDHNQILNDALSMLNLNESNYENLWLQFLEEAKKKKPYKPNFSKEKEQGLHGWFARNKGKGWINCRTGGPCGRSDADEGGKYPACRPTKAQCKSAGKGPLRKKKSSKPISWTKKKKD